MSKLSIIFYDFVLQNIKMYVHTYHMHPPTAWLHIQKSASSQENTPTQFIPFIPEAWDEHILRWTVEPITNLETPGKVRGNKPFLGWVTQCQKLFSLDLMIWMLSFCGWLSNYTISLTIRNGGQKHTKGKENISSHHLWFITTRKISTQRLKVILGPVFLGRSGITYKMDQRWQGTNCIGWEVKPSHLRFTRIIWTDRTMGPEGPTIFVTRRQWCSLQQIGTQSHNHLRK